MPTEVRVLSAVREVPREHHCSPDQENQDCGYPQVLDDPQSTQGWPRSAPTGRHPRETTDAQETSRAARSSHVSRRTTRRGVLDATGVGPRAGQLSDTFSGACAERFLGDHEHGRTEFVSKIICATVTDDQHAVGIRPAAWRQEMQQFAHGALCALNLSKRQGPSAGFLAHHPQCVQRCARTTSSGVASAKSSISESRTAMTESTNADPSPSRNT